MFELNWAELILIGFVALIVIGPEDLPDMFRQLGRFTAKLRQMSREFSRAMEEAAKQSGMKDAADDLKAATSVKSLGLDAVREAADKFEKWDPIKNAAKPSMTMPARSMIPPPMPATPPLVVDDAAEAADDLALVVDEASLAEPVVAENTIHGPETQALYDKQALRAQVLAEQTEKLKAIEAGTYAVAPAASLAPAPAATSAPAVAAMTPPTAAPVAMTAAPVPVTPAAVATPAAPVPAMPAAGASPAVTAAPVVAAASAPAVAAPATDAPKPAPRKRVAKVKDAPDEAAPAPLKTARKSSNKADQA